MIREISDQKRTENALRASGEQLRDFAARIEAAREDERTRISRELHDELGQALTALKLDLAWTQKHAGMAGIRKKMEAMIADVDDTIERVRRISSELRPSILDDLGLSAAIEWQVAQFRKRTRIRTELVSAAETLTVSREVAVAVFRAVQEALTNVMRHSGQTRSSVHVTRNEQELTLQIDNDAGKAGSEASRDGIGLGQGILGMQERATALGGVVEAGPRPDGGFRVFARLPLDGRPLTTPGAGTGIRE
jgi:signal transduction histidine kinase